MTDSDPREVIPAGRLRPPSSWVHLVPLARFLVVERGHLPIHEPARWGFTGAGSFQFSRRITEADWEALNQHFVIPPNIWFDQGLIRDQDNRADLFGADEVEVLNGMEPIDAWEAKERALDRTYGRPDLGEGKAGPVPPA